MGRIRRCGWGVADQFSGRDGCLLQGAEDGIPTTAPERIAPVRHEPNLRLLDSDELLEIAARILTGPRRQEAMWDLERMVRESSGGERGKREAAPDPRVDDLEGEIEGLMDEVVSQEMVIRDLRAAAKKAPKTPRSLQRVAEQAKEYGGLAKAPPWLLEEMERVLEAVRGEG